MGSQAYPGTGLVLSPSGRPKWLAFLGSSVLDRATAQLAPGNLTGLGPQERVATLEPGPPPPCLPTSALVLLLVLCAKWPPSFSQGKNKVADGHHGPGWDTVQIQLRPQTCPPAKRLPPARTEEPPTGAPGGRATGGEGGARSTLPQGQSSSVWYAGREAEYQSPAPPPPHSAEPGSLERSDPPTPSRPWGRGKGRAGDPGKTQDLGHLSHQGFLSTGETPHWRREEGPGIKAALGTISPRLLNWPLGPLLMPFGGFPAVWGGRGCTPSKGVSEASPPQALQAPSHLQHLGGKQPVPVPRAIRPGSLS